jgi:predicted DNA-binding protein (MmcQ/YjbR family)
MDIATLQSLCLSFPSVTQDVKWEDHLCFNVGGKMFLITSPDHVPVSASLKVADDEFEELSARPGCNPAAYLARYKWIYVTDIGAFTASEWQRLARKSYDLVRAKLPKKVQQGLGE